MGRRIATGARGGKAAGSCVPLPWVTRYARAFLHRRWPALPLELDHDEVQAVLDVAAESAPHRRPAP